MDAARFGRFGLGAVAVAGLLAGGLAQVIPAHADFTWCWDDPQIGINGHVVTILTGFQADAATVHDQVQSTNIVVHIPRNLSAQVLRTTNTYVTENVTIVADQDSWSAGKDLHVQAEATFTRTAAGVAAGDKAPDITTGLQISGDGGQTYLGKGHVHDKLHHDYVFHHDGSKNQPD